jgi:8-oxo-dGTP diphosphatase
MGQMTNFYETLPKKRLAAAALFLNESGEMLIVKPTYRPDWLIPGGTIEENESPWTACIREVNEEINLDIVQPRLLAVDYTEHHDEVTEVVHFVFFGGILTPADVQRIVIPSDELSEYRIVPPTAAISILNPRLAKRIPHCLDALNTGTTAYLENGQPR